MSDCADGWGIPGRTMVAAPLALLTLFAAAAASAADQAPAALASDGRALLPIVISAHASPATVAVAAELAEYLGRISGARFAIEAADGSRGIVLGTLAEFPHPELAPALAPRQGADGREAFAIRTAPDRVLLLGASALGASHAAYRMLEELGCRWFFPGRDWEVVPTRPQLSFILNADDRPAILSRSMWFEAGSGGEQQNADYVAWRRRNRQAESFQVNAGHNLDEVIRRNQAVFDKHPEFLALVDGKRQGPQLELADPAVRKLVDDYAVGFFAEHPDADMVSLEPADNTAHSQSRESLALGSVSDRVFGMANEAARVLQEKHPGKMVGLYSYNAHWDPPAQPLDPHVHVLLASLGQGALTPAERDAAWPQRCRNLGFYEYFSVGLWSYDRLPGSWTNDCAAVQRRMRDIVAKGGTSVSAESTSSWGSNGRGYYIANRLMWNPEADVPALLQDFYEQAFGPGAAAMKRYYERLDPARRPFLSKHLLGLAFRDVDAAAIAARDRPDVQLRLDHLKRYLRYIHLDWLRNREAQSPERAAALTTAVMTLLYRTRASAFTAWEMIRQNWGANKQPGKDQADWMVERPCSQEETERDFQEGIAYFQPRLIGAPVAFSEDLAPVRWAGLPQAASRITSQQFYQGSQVYALWSAAGEPLEFETWAGDAWHGINRFVLTDAEGHEVAKGQLKNNETTHHRIPVPHPGLYYLDYDDNGSQWSMTVAPGQAATIPLGSQRDFRNTKVMQEMYFYVPKGTRRIEYYYTRTAFHPGGPHQVLYPSGALAKAVDVNGDWVTVEVPAGMDGALWRLRDPVLGLFWFNNLPNYIAASPSALLLPRELIERDGLPR